ncbi:MAG TPA: hypothetical protein VG714_05505 [Acidobacteriaceae bacterium]|nr:hypothetical protein [Acidobacteriaceae bacterium]
MNLTLRLATILFTIALATAPSAPAQATTKSEPDSTAAKASRERLDANNFPERTFYFRYITNQNEMNECVTALRVSLPPYVKTFLVPSMGAIIVRASPEDTDLAAKILNDLDRPRKAYRLTYTVTEMDGDKRVGAQHYSLVAVSGQQTVLKQGDRVPIAVAAAPGKDTSSAGQTQFAYQDVGMVFNATVDDFHDGARLRSDVVQSSLAGEKSNVGVQDPVFRQSELKGEAMLVPGKPLVLGTMDIPGSTHHLQVEALIDPLP